MLMQRRKYDFFGPASTSTSAGRSSRTSSSYSGSAGAGGAAGFDFDSYWNQYRSKEERPQDIDDSFGRIFSDLINGAPAG